MLKTIRVLIALLLFGQFTLLAQACALPKVAPSMLQASDSHGAMPCCKHMSKNACLSQATQSDETTTATGSMLPVQAASPELVVPRSVAAAPRIASETRAAYDFSEPPPAIRFCSFQT